MSNEKKQARPCDFGRVFFPEKTNEIPEIIYFQPLGNHVGNVRKLVRLWDFSNFDRAFREESQKRVDEAAKVHDMDKPSKFRIKSETKKDGTFKEYIYSFRGHRFEAKSNDDWAQSLARGHHDYSIGCVVEDIYKLKRDFSEYREILEIDPLAYAKELYILEMCDQIEAELACRIIGNDKQAESRTFMDYTLFPQGEDYAIAPFPFREDCQISLSFAYWSMNLSNENKNELENCDTKKGEKLGKILDKIVKKWWETHQGKLEKAEIKTRKIVRALSHFHKIYTDCRDFYQSLGESEEFLPNAMQVDVFQKISEANPAILVKSPTGSGKFEAIVFASLANQQRLILPLPTKSLIEDQRKRAETYLKRFSQLNKNCDVSLVIDTGFEMKRHVYRNGKEETSLQSNPRRHLYKGDIILTTLDKFLYRYFGYGDSHKSCVFPLRIHQEKTLICFDEAHSYENIAFTNFQSLISSLYEAGRSLVLMTATMPKELVEQFHYLDVIDYVDRSENLEKLAQIQSNKGFEWIENVKRDRDDPSNFQHQFFNVILQEWQKQENPRIIAVIEYVKDAVEIYKSLKQYLGGNSNENEQFLFLYHGRIAEQERLKLYDKIKQRDRENKHYLLITTSAIEVGCDLNCEILISQMCPPENLIQRAGRCNRKGNIDNAKVVLVGHEIPPWVNSLDDIDLQNYHTKLRSLQNFNIPIISECISRKQQVDDYRVVELFSMLHDYVYQADLTCQPTHQRGLIPTRSWTPSVTLIYEDTEKEEDKHHISVPIDRFCKTKKNDESYDLSHISVFERWYDTNNTRWNERLLGWGEAYRKNILVRISPSSGYDYNSEFGFVEIPQLFINITNSKTDGTTVKLMYKDEQHKSIITYVKSFDE